MSRRRSWLSGARGAIMQGSTFSFTGVEVVKIEVCPVRLVVPRVLALPGAGAVSAPAAGPFPLGDARCHK
jgi:hypothetical protein